MKRIVNWDNVPVILSTEETKGLLGIRERTLRKMDRHGEIPAKKINNEWRFLKEEIYDWIHKNKASGKQEKNENAV